MRNRQNQITPDHPNKPSISDQIGRTYGELTVRADAGRRSEKDRARMVWASCSCGKPKWYLYRLWDLKAGKTTNCHKKGNSFKRFWDGKAENLPAAKLRALFIDATKAKCDWAVASQHKIHAYLVGGAVRVWRKRLAAKFGELFYNATPYKRGRDQSLPKRKELGLSLIEFCWLRKLVGANGRINLWSEHIFQYLPYLRDMEEPREPLVLTMDDLDPPLTEAMVRWGGLDPDYLSYSALAA